MKPKLIIGAALAGLVLVFTIQNVTVMNLRFLFWTLSIPGALLMLLILSVGVILGWLLQSGFGRRKNNSEILKDWAQRAKQ